MNPRATRGACCLHQTNAFLKFSNEQVKVPQYKVCFIILVIVVAFTSSAAQQKQPEASPSPSPTPAAHDEQEPIKILTEEVRLPIQAYDQFGYFDPTLVADDILVLEDRQPQQIRSVRQLAANVLIVLDTGGELSGLGGMSKRTNLTREVARELVRSLHRGDWMAVMQFNDKVDLLQRWTTNRDEVLQTLKTKVFSGKRDVFSDAIAAAAQQMLERPEGSRHVVLVTDGVDTAGVKADRAKAVKQLIDARTTVHIISYTEFVRQKNPQKQSDIQAGMRPVANDPITATDPTLAPGQTRNPSFGIGIRFDPAMRRQRKAYEDDIKKSQQRLSALAQETGGTIFLPKTRDEMMGQANAVAKEIGAEYVITYRPTRPLAAARPGEYRRIEVQSRRVGLSLRARRGYVANTRQE
jgi:VWFA-related protein